MSLVPRNNNSELAVFSNPEQMALVVSAIQQATQPNLRRQRDAFEMIADRDYLDKVVKTASFLDSLRHYRRGQVRFATPLRSAC